MGPTYSSLVTDLKQDEISQAMLEEVGAKNFPYTVPKLLIASQLERLPRGSFSARDVTWAFGMLLVLNSRYDRQCSTLLT